MYVALGRMASTKPLLRWDLLRDWQTVGRHACMTPNTQWNTVLGSHDGSVPLFCLKAARCVRCSLITQKRYFIFRKQTSKSFWLRQYSDLHIPAIRPIFICNEVTCFVCVSCCASAAAILQGRRARTVNTSHRFAHVPKLPSAKLPWAAHSTTAALRTTCIDVRQHGCALGWTSWYASICDAAATWPNWASPESSWKLVGWAGPISCRSNAAECSILPSICASIRYCCARCYVWTHGGACCTCFKLLPC